ncbi:hypothetical protein HB884_11470 [Listeria booriae]|uniref:MBL fold metallo-hydrolase n=1 Tax=Listeria booriae TaxID=1552123 RepID=UPI0016298BA1|nr:MBL fold metallo-hydrolase [Listeria booriae]MBC1524819.1 hypothetical protein [Listeria booriae]
MIKYEIISSGSKGNCVIINDIMIDCGVPFGSIKEQLYDIKYLLITHIHSDHVKEHILNRIKKMFPKIQIISNWEVAQRFGIDDIVNANFPVEFGFGTLTPFECIHDVVTYGYVIQMEGENIIYATDTATLKNAPIPSEGYDYLFLESNHDEKKLEQVRNKNNYGYDPYKGGMRHLSTQKCKAFYYTHRRNKESPLIELHKSERFY